MLNLLRMDLYRMVRSKSVYISFGILLFAQAFTFFLLYALTDPSTTKFLLEHGVVISSNIADGQAELAMLSTLELFHQGTIGGGFFACITGIFAALFICSDYSSGFMKNIICSHENRWDYILSKVSSLCIINLIYLTGIWFLTLGLNMLFGGFFNDISFVDTCFYFFSIWMIENGFSALVIFLCILIRHIGGAIATVLFLCGGVVVSLLHSILAPFGLEWIAERTLYYSLATFNTSMDGAYDWSLCVTGLFFFILYTVLGKIILSKRDL